MPSKCGKKTKYESVYNHPIKFSNHKARPKASVPLSWMVEDDMRERERASQSLRVLLMHLADELARPYTRTLKSVMPFWNLLPSSDKLKQTIILKNVYHPGPWISLSSQTSPWLRTAPNKTKCQLSPNKTKCQPTIGILLTKWKLTTNKMTVQTNKSLNFFVVSNTRIPFCDYLQTEVMWSKFNPSDRLTESFP